MTKVKFEVGKEYIDNHGENYTVVSRDAEFVTVEPVGFFSNYKCEVAEDANGNEEIKEIKVGRVKSTLKANFGLTEIKARVDMQEKALAKAVEDFETSLNAGLNLNRLVLAAGNIGYCLEEIARMETLIAQGKTGARKFTGADGAIYFTGIDGATYLVKSEKFFLAVENAEGDEIDAIHEFKTIEDALKSFVDSGEKVGDIFDENEIPVCGIGYGRIYTDYKEVRDFYYELKANEINDCIDDYIVDIDAAVEVEEINAENGAAEIENAQAAVEEVSPSIEKIFAAVTTEIKPHIKGKYFVQIDDNWREQNVREIFATLEDAVKVARLMYSELRKVSRHIYATVEARTVDINKLWDRADDWTTFYEINSEGEKINRRETIAVIAKIDNRTVEEVRNDIGRYGDNYGFYKNSAPVEEVEAEKNPLKAKVEEILNRPRKPIIDWKATFEDMKISEILSFQKDLKKFLKLGEIDLAENVFSMLKTLCRNYRAVAA